MLSLLLSLFTFPHHSFQRFSRSNFTFTFDCLVALETTLQRISLATQNIFS